MFRRATEPDPRDTQLQVATPDGNISIAYRRMFPVDMTTPGLIWQPLGAPTPICFEVLTEQEPPPRFPRLAEPVIYSDHVLSFLDQQERRRSPQIILKEKEFRTSRYYMFITHDRGERMMIAEDRWYPLVHFKASGLHSLYNHFKRDKAIWSPLTLEENEDRFLLTSLVPKRILQKVQTKLLNSYLG